MQCLRLGEQTIDTCVFPYLSPANGRIFLSIMCFCPERAPDLVPPAAHLWRTSTATRAPFHRRTVALLARGG